LRKRFQWGAARITDALRFVSPARAREVATRTKNVKAAARVDVRGDFRVVGDCSAWTGPSRRAVEAWGKHLRIEIGRQRVTVRGVVSGETYLFEGKAIAAAFALPVEVPIKLVGEIVFLDPASSRGLKATTDPRGRQTLTPIRPR
jgi:hypothetical protein